MLLLLSHEGTWAGTVGEKRAMLASGGPLFVVWPGQWSTTVRTLDGAGVLSTHPDNAKKPAHPAGAE